MWSKRERVLAALSGERPDQVPIFECVAHDAVLEHFGKAPARAGDRDQVVKACAEFIDLNHPPLVPQEPARIEHADGNVEVRERWNTWHPNSTIYGDGSQYIEGFEREIAECLSWKPQPGEAENWRAGAKGLQQTAGEMVQITYGCSVAIMPLDLEQGALFQFDYPKLTDRWAKARNERLLRQADAFPDSASAPVAIVWDDIAAKGGLLYPPAMLEEFLYPYLAKLAEILHGKGIKMLFHSDGDVTAALPRLIACGIDGFNPLETSAGMKPQAFKDACRKAGKKPALVGGIDAVATLAHGTPEDVARETRALIDLFREDGNLCIASASGEIDNSMPLANVLAMYETTWKYGRY